MKKSNITKQLLKLRTSMTSSATFKTPTILPKLKLRNNRIHDLVSNVQDPTRNSSFIPSRNGDARCASVRKDTPDGDWRFFDNLRSNGGDFIASMDASAKPKGKIKFITVNAPVVLLKPFLSFYYLLDLLSQSQQQAIRG